MNSYDKYDTFWKRWLASVIDGLVFLPLDVAVSIKENSTNTTAFLLFSILHVFLFTLYVVIGHGRYGQTLGKKLMRIKVLNVRETGTIGYGRAFLRESPWFLAQMAGLVYLIVTIQNSTGPFPFHHTYFDSIIDLISLVWWILEVATMLLNKKRRALHDLIAGSVVVDLDAIRREELDKRQEDLMQSLRTG